MTKRDARLLVVYPTYLSGQPETDRWIAQIESFQTGKQMDSRNDTAHSMRPLDMSVRLASFASIGSEAERWWQRVELIPDAVQSIEAAIGTAAGEVTHVAMVGASPTDFAALANIIARIGGIGSVQTVWVAMNAAGLLALQEPFGLQVAGRVQAMFDATGVDLVMLSSGAASATILDDIGLVRLGDLPPTPFSGYWQLSNRRVVAIDLDKDGHEKHHLALSFLHAMAKSAELSARIRLKSDQLQSFDWLSLVEEALISGRDVILKMPADPRLDQAIAASPILSPSKLPGNGISFSGAKLWSNRDWRLQVDAARWALQLVRAEHDQLGYYVKELRRGGEDVRIDLR